MLKQKEVEMDVEKIFGEKKLAEILGEKRARRVKSFLKECRSLPEARRNLRQLKRVYFSQLTSPDGPDGKFKYFEKGIKKVVDLLEYNPYDLFRAG